MVRRRERVTATLLVWVMLLIALGMIMDRLNYSRLNSLNHWFNSGGVVTGTNPEEAQRIIESAQEVSNGAYMQANHFAQTELYSYAPHFLLICALLLLGGALATFFVWRSVVVTQPVSERLTTNEASALSTGRRLSSLLSDDGELDDGETPLVHHNGQD